MTPKRYDPATEARIDRRAEKLRASMMCQRCGGQRVLTKVVRQPGARVASYSVPCPDCSLPRRK